MYFKNSYAFILMIKPPVPGPSSSNTPKVKLLSENSLNKINGVCSIFSLPCSTQEQSRNMKLWKKKPLKHFSSQSCLNTNLYILRENLEN